MRSVPQDVPFELSKSTFGMNSNFSPWTEVHTEAVAGIVGRAELVSAICFLLSLLAQRSRGWGLLCALLAAAATLAKEQEVTVLGVSILELLAGRSKKNLLQIGLSLVTILSLRAAALSIKRESK